VINLAWIEMQENEIAKWKDGMWGRGIVGFETRGSRSKQERTGFTLFPRIAGSSIIRV